MDLPNFQIRALQLFKMDSVPSFKNLQTRKINFPEGNWANFAQPCREMDAEIRSLKKAATYFLIL